MWAARSESGVCGAVSGVECHLETVGSGGVDGARLSDGDDLGVMAFGRRGLRDVKVESDQFVPGPQKGLKGIRVLVHG